MSKPIYMLLILVLLSGCSSRMQMIEQECGKQGLKRGMKGYGDCYRIVEQRMDLQERWQRDSCFRYGFKDGTPEYSKCAMELDMQRSRQSHETYLQQLKSWQPQPKPLEFHCRHLPGSGTSTCTQW